MYMYMHLLYPWLCPNMRLTSYTPVHIDCFVLTQTSYILAHMDVPIFWYLSYVHVSPSPLPTFLLPSLPLVGEPLNDEAWLWYHHVVGEGRCTVVDTWWQTGTCTGSVVSHAHFLYTCTCIHLHVLYCTCISHGLR